ncbi:hypothetical protein LIER_00628 [Lithospermum erythrorhizon]|uniref:Uncharacterized protein n=1 Tax=Lithospermum erythrorhizon TaxID=34254 RepID=A0AAV3NIU9_LITER
MPKFKTFSGFGDPSNYLKSFDSQLSFWASDDEMLEEVKILSEEMAEIRGKKVADEGTHRSPKRTRVWDRLQKPREKEPFKRLQVRSPRREEGRIKKPQEPMFDNYTLLRKTVGRVYAQVEDKRIFSRP